MAAPPEVIEVLRQWVRKAEHDLEAARRILAVEDGCPNDTVCFHCQQAVEKYLKALLTLAAVPAPRAHDLNALCSLLPPEQRASLPSVELAILNPYAVEVRYADDWREPGREDAIEALRLAEQVRDQARKVLPSEVVAEG
jgi:HEPN domain-containing protein